MENIKKKHLQAAWFAMIFFAMVILIVLQYHAFTEYNQIRAFKQSAFLITEAEKIIARNHEDHQELLKFLKKSYLEKARAAAYILDVHPEIEENADSLQMLAQVLGVDQIHLFDPEGRIYSSTDPNYLGLTMDSGSQIHFFKPMLEDQSLELAQDIFPNSAEGKSMLYTMCWNQNGTKMVQVGAYGERFPRLLSNNRIDMFIELVPGDPTMDIILTDKGSDLIIAATNASYTGKTLEEIGILPEDEINDDQVDFVTGFDHNPIYCSAKSHMDYHIYIAQYKNKIDESLSITLFTFAEYLTLVFIGMSFIIDYFYNKFMQEKAYAMRDKLTDLYSRRAYEMKLSELESQSLNPDLVFVSMDVNGLKTINDQLGHQAGDTLLRGAAYCMLNCFGPYGSIYRFGGDEFAALIQAKDIELSVFKDHLMELCAQWSEENNISLSVSIGFSRSIEHPEASIHTLEAIADQEMYADKSMFYSKTKNNRRGIANENQ